MVYRFALLLGPTLFIAHSAFAGLPSYNQTDALLDSVSDSLFLKVKIEQSLADENLGYLQFQMQSQLYTKAATPEFSVKEAYWKWKRSEAITRFLKSNLRLKELEIKLNGSKELSPHELELIYKARRGERLESARAELSRAQGDASFYGYWKGKNDKLYPSGAISKEEHLQVTYQFEGANAQVARIETTLAELEKIVGGR